MTTTTTSTTLTPAEGAVILGICRSFRDLPAAEYLKGQHLYGVTVHDVMESAIAKLERSICPPEELGTLEDATE